MMKKTVVLGVSSGIAAYKSVELVRLLKKDGFEVFVIMTKSAAKMVHPNEFAKASENKVYTELFEEKFNYKDVLKIRKVDHIDLADKADIFVVAPATANTVAKIAHGMADDFLTTTLLATHAKALICPSMNVHMWRSPLVQENISKLRSAGFVIVHPERGRLACGYEGEGRLPHIETIKNEVVRHLSVRQPLLGRSVLVTAGGTLEAIDGARYIGNRSSGKMGVAIAEECMFRGASVTLLRSRSSVSPRYLIPQETFETGDELERLIKKHVKKYDIMFHVAAVSDFVPVKTLRGKIASETGITLKLRPRRKIVDHIKQLNPKIKLIVFKADWGLAEDEVPSIARKKLKESNADAIVVNDVKRIDRGFGTDTNEVFVVTKSGSKIKIPLASKQDIARGIIDFLTSKLLQ